VDAILRGMDAFNSGDDEGYVSLAHPDVEWDAGLLGTSTYRGQEGVRKHLRDVRAAWADLQAEVVGTPTDMDEWVVWEIRLRGHGRTTGAPVEGSQFLIAKFREGLVERGGACASRAEALEAVGTSE
jgi:ketosteroid isomerase-like protein